jgi:hypothetical protein
VNGRSEARSAKPILRGPVNGAKEQKASVASQSAGTDVHILPPGASAPVGNGDVATPGRKGAAAALERLESAEELAHRRLEAALARGNPVEVQACQDFWLKCSETLRRLDLAVEVARRQEETQIPLKVAEQAVVATAEWLRISVTTFLSSETISLMGIKDPGEFRSYFGQRFVGNLNLVIKSADQTRSRLPPWAKMAIASAWNVPLD